MELTRFKFFRRLPPAVRRRIWRYAVRPLDAHGINDFLIYRDDQIQKVARFLKPPAPREVKEWIATIPGLNDNAVNRSAYTWDAGLWTACWESRQIIKAAFEASSAKKHTLKYSIIRAPQLRSSGNGASTHDWSLVLPGTGDTYRLSFYNCLRLVEESWAELDWREVLHNISCSAKSYSDTRYFIFDYDQSWSQDLPWSWTELCSELTPRGLVASLIETCYHIAKDGYCKWHIYLIDRSGYYRGSERQNISFLDEFGGDKIRFYDCDEEFDDIGWGVFEEDRKDRRTASHYVHRLSSKYGSFHLRILDHVRILMPWSNSPGPDEDDEDFEGVLRAISLRAVSG